MVVEDSTGRSGVMAGEDKGLDLSHCKVSEIHIKAFGGRVDLEVGFQG